MTAKTPIPRSALVLGWAGVIPFAALTAATVLKINLPLSAAAALIDYAVAILSFMGGAQWGLTVADRGSTERPLAGYAISVVPALLGWSSLSLDTRPALVVLIAGFAFLLAYDLWTVRLGKAPPWYAALRMQLTGAVVALLTMAFFAARGS